jgi:hypothetical protein
MAKGRLATIGTRAFVASLVMCMSLMMVPATAFAEIGGVAYEVEVDASQDDAINTLAANATGVELELVADANALAAGDRVEVFYDNQLLDTFTVA